MTLQTKLNPARFPGMSGKMAAITGYIIGEDFTDPALIELTVTSDGIVLGTREGDCGANEWIGSASDLERNWRALLDVAGLTPSERAAAETRYATRITDWRQP